jgi:nucleoside-diphosphate-sugar epimerase
VLHALNPPYTEWPRLALPFAETAIAAARASGATLMFPGNIYNYGAGMPPVLDEATPMLPTSRKGALRVEIEDRMRAAARDGVRTIVLRAGDFYGTAAAGSWFGRVIVKDIVRGRLSYPGRLDVVHEWAYVPDLVSAMVRLAAIRDQLSGFASFGFPGHAVTGRAFAAAIARTVHRELRVGTMPWWFIRALGPVVPIFRELAEMAYLWQVPHRISGERLKSAIGAVPATPFDAAIAGALADLRLLPSR